MPLSMLPADHQGLTQWLVETLFSLKQNQPLIPFLSSVRTPFVCENSSRIEGSSPRAAQNPPTSSIFSNGVDGFPSFLYLVTQVVQAGFGTEPMSFLSLPDLFPDLLFLQLDARLSLLRRYLSHFG